VWVKFVLRTIYFSLLIVALLGPSFSQTSKEVKTEGKDIFVAVDLSLSMNATDIQPSRIEKVKFELKRIIEALPSDRLGLIIFSSEAFLQCPLTFDRSALQLWTDALRTSLVTGSSTDLATPLRMALQRFDSDAKDGDNQARIVLLISDGEDWGDELRPIAKELRDKKITVFTLGIGTTEGGRIPARDGGGFKLDPDGKEVLTRLNRDALEDLADITSGRYFEINETRNDVSKLIAAINQVEGRLRGVQTMDVSANNYQYFLAIAFLLILIDIIFTAKTLRI
jgi:Ca-activated chloride channel family protein